MLIFCGSICILKGCFMLHVKTKVINCHETVDSRGLQIDIAKKSIEYTLIDKACTLYVHSLYINHV